MKKCCRDATRQADKDAVSRTVIGRILSQAKKYSKNYAVVHSNNAITYQELMYKANILAAYLSKNVDKGSIIAICAKRSVEMIIGIVAILKLGCAYLPLNEDDHKIVCSIF